MTDRIGDLVLELGQLESYDSVNELLVRDEISLKNILCLYSETDDVKSRYLIQQILDEVGYGWFDELEPEAVEGAQSQSGTAKFVDSLSSYVSEWEFMKMLPANSYIH